MRALSERDRSILVALTRKIRLLTLSQVARTWWQETESGLLSARRVLDALEEEGLVKSVRVLAHPELPLDGPIVRWQPGDGRPAIGSVAYRLQTRWTKQIEELHVWCADAKARKQFGGQGNARLKQPLQATHDLHVSTVYVRRLAQAPDEAAAWVSEETLARTRRGRKLPDAALVDASGRVTLVIEFGGAYRAERVALVHEDCERRGIPYELW
jgi:hypothetical protein